MKDREFPAYKQRIVKWIGRVTKCHAYCYSKGRIRIGKYRIESGLHRLANWEIGCWLEKGGYEGDEVQMHISALPFYIYISKEIGHQKSPTRYGALLSKDHLQLFYGKYDFCGEGDLKFITWRENLLSFLFGKTLYFRHKVDFSPKKVMIPMPEGSYEAFFTRERSCWMRPRWVFREVRKSIDIDIPKGIPFAGKGENSYDMDDDGLFGMGSDGWDEAKAIRAVQDSVNRNRERYGYPRPESILRARSESDT